MEYQKKILGFIYIIAGVVLIALLSLFTILLFAMPVDSFFHSEFHPGRNPEVGAPEMFRVISVAGSMMMASFLAIPSVIVGIGLNRQKEWADDLMFPIGGCYLLFFPLGTAIGLYGLIVFLANRKPPHSLSSRQLNTEISARY